MTSKFISAQCLCASPSQQREYSPVLFTQPNQHPSAAASNIILFSWSDGEMDDSLSLAASDAEALSGSVHPFHAMPDPERTRSLSVS